MSEKTKKPQKLRARLPRGFVDREAHDIRAVNEMTAKIREVYERYGFDPIETPLFEYTDALGKFLPDSDRPNEGVFSLQDDDEQWMSLRYDLTAPLARHVAENFNEIQLPYRTYRAGYVFRNEKPGPGRFRQFMQFDADSVGAPGVQADAEMCMMMADTLEALGIKRGDYVIRVNNRKVLDGVMEAIGLGGDENAARRLNVLRAIDKLDKFPVNEIRKLLGSGRWDGGEEGKGDFTKGAGLNEQQIEIVLWLCDREIREVTGPVGNDIATIQVTYGDNAKFNPTAARIVATGYDINSGIYKEGKLELSNMQSLFTAAGYGPDRILIDPSVVRGLEYYTGPVYEAELTFDVTNEKGEKVVFGSVGGGGRYDGLVSRFMGQPVPATGFSIGVSRLMTALKNLGKLGADEVIAPVLITVMDGQDVDALGKYQKFTQDLRNAGIRAEMYQGNWKKFGNQLKYADRRGSPIAIIQGGDEREQGVVQIKDLIEGKRLSGEITDNTEWREARVAQIVVPEAELVAKVKEILAAQADDRARAK
ncbi:MULTISPECIES: histidine--tRNA ligase [Rhizobium/Agrobacterium group]|uniref:histidine--tRNA ligase n=1 Tax=Rhizobium/Agrobacterium group TaxID=227290 RepID=UPI000B3FEB24|nr:MULTISPECIES: histidine--tRNA ligase [Rhizobium/Agrobacterium group]MCF1481361.1 histidine--tRNA ligase [Allorhizobium ampelinum]NSZ45212.1 histidine--tRNA ligase [Agrobacterium vitis]NTA28959.1 histidine--tRNA ligase [Allorhizobium ampelinum]OVE90904.1 histidine--tRNA ligase [Allorhizobium ampelinum]